MLERSGLTVTTGAIENVIGMNALLPLRLSAVRDGRTPKLSMLFHCENPPIDYGLIIPNCSSLACSDFLLKSLDGCLGGGKVSVDQLSQAVVGPQVLTKGLSQVFCRISGPEQASESSFPSLCCDTLLLYKAVYRTHPSRLDPKLVLEP
jgi:hypothetical protein